VLWKKRHSVGGDVIGDVADVDTSGTYNIIHRINYHRSSLVHNQLSSILPISSSSSQLGLLIPCSDTNRWGNSNRPPPRTNTTITATNTTPIIPTIPIIPSKLLLNHNITQYQQLLLHHNLHLIGFSRHNLRGIHLSIETGDEYERGGNSSRVGNVGGWMGGHTGCCGGGGGSG